MNSSIKEVKVGIILELNIKHNTQHKVQLTVFVVSKAFNYISWPFLGRWNFLLLSCENNSIISKTTEQTPNSLLRKATKCG